MVWAVKVDSVRVPCSSFGSMPRGRRDHEAAGFAVELSRGGGGRRRSYGDGKEIAPVPFSAPPSNEAKMYSMRYYSVECEAPGGLGPSSVYTYDVNNAYINNVSYLDLEFEIWLGGELVEYNGHYCVSESLWEFLAKSGIKGVSVRDMTVTLGEHVNDLHPGRVIPQFMQLILPESLGARQRDAWRLSADTIPDSDMFTGSGQLFVNERIKNLLSTYGVSGLRFEEALAG